MRAEIAKLKFTNKILVIALIVASFFLGSLTNKVATLKKNTPTNPTPQAAAPNAPGAPQQPTAGKVKPVSASDHITGNANSKVSLIVYSDFECPFCKTFNTTMLDIEKAYGDKIKIVFRHYPLPFHQNAQKEAEASECVAALGGQDAFWKYINVMFERTTSNGTGIALDQLGPMTAELGVNQEAFQSCLDSGKYEKLVKDSITEGQTAGVSGTPSSIIIDANGKPQLLVGAQPIDAFKTALDKVLTGK